MFWASQLSSGWLVWLTGGVVVSGAVMQGGMKGDGGQSDGGLLEVSEEHRSCDVMMFEQEEAELNLLF